jgi:hypothetical protein
MNATERTAARGRFDNWRELGEDRRELMRERWSEFQELPRAQQETIRRDFNQFRRLSVQRRAELRRQWQQKSVTERQQSLRELRERRLERRPNR